MKSYLIKLSFTISRFFKGWHIVNPLLFLYYPKRWNSKDISLVESTPSPYCLTIAVMPLVSFSKLICLFMKIVPLLLPVVQHSQVRISVLRVNICWQEFSLLVFFSFLLDEISTPALTYNVISVFIFWKQEKSALYCFLGSNVLLSLIRKHFTLQSLPWV